MSEPGELDALPLADLLDPDSAATKLELRHALGLAWGEVLRLRGGDVTDVADDCPADGGSLRGDVKSDWTTSRVVRDASGDMWARVRPQWWAYLGGQDTQCAEEFLNSFGPLVPVLDADGLPFVHTVGDLTARHLGGYVSIEGGPPARLLAMRKPLPGELRVALFVSTYGADPASTDYLPLDTPCEAM